MTRDEILEMKDKRQLDCLVAENILGWYNVQLRDEIGYVCWGINPITKESTYIPRYSNDIKMAWEVVEKLKNDFLFDLSFSNKWCCQFLKFHERIGEVDKYIATSETAPEAIVKAALLAMMEEKNDKNN